MENGKKKLIWFVDDEVIIARMLKYDLDKRGYECEIFPSVDKAAEELEKRKPDLIITDYNTGAGMNGLDLLKKAGDIPVIMQSGTDNIKLADGREVSLESEAKKNGVRHFLKKPFDVKKLLDAIYEVLPEPTVISLETRTR